MAKKDFAPVMKAEKYPLGHAKENKDASAYTGFKYPAGGGDDIGVYKQPMENMHKAAPDVVAKRGNGMNENNMSIAGVSKGNYGAENKHGEKMMRGYGAATKGRKISGKMG